MEKRIGCGTQDSQCSTYKHNTQELSCKAVSVACCETVCSHSDAASKVHALYYIVFSGLSGCNVFFFIYLINGKNF